MHAHATAEPVLIAPAGHKEELRRARLHEVYELLQRRGSMPAEEIRTYLIWSYGLAHSTAGEYIHTLLLCNKAQVIDGILYPK